MGETTLRPEGEGTNKGEGAEPAAKKGSVTRRTFAIGVGSTIVLLGLGSFRYLGSTSLVRPPGGQDEDTLIGKCIHCYRCIEVCPHDLLRSSKLEYGLFGMRTPRMEFSDNYPGDVSSLKYCDFCAESNGGMPLCVEVCPSTALSLPDDFDPDTARIGTAELDTNLCMAYRSGSCVFCYDACVQVRGEGQEAIYFVEDPDNGTGATLLPEVDADLCNGCGACESICVSTQAGSTLDATTRAIVVKPLADGGE